MSQITTVTEAKEHLINVGVANLILEYPHVDKENILNDYVYASFFRSSLKITMEDLKGTTLKDNKKIINLYRSAIVLLTRIITNNLK